MAKKQPIKRSLAQKLPMCRFSAQRALILLPAESSRERAIGIGAWSFGGNSGRRFRQHVAVH